MGVAVSVTLRVKLKVPCVVAVPDIVPAALSERPVGRVPEARVQLYGGVPAVAAAVWEYAELTRPLGKAAVVMDRVLMIVMGKLAVPARPLVSVARKERVWAPRE